jgi:hypothetical protein
MMYAVVGFIWLSNAVVLVTCWRDHPVALLGALYGLGLASCAIALAIVGKF